MKIVPLTALALAIGLSSAAQAAPINLVINGDFQTDGESPVFSSWNNTTNGSKVTRSNDVAGRRTPGADQYAAKFDYTPPSLVQSLWQEVATTVGSTYTVSFWYKLNGTGQNFGTDDKFRWDFRSPDLGDPTRTVLGDNFGSSTSYAQVQQDVVADASSMYLRFSAFAKGGAWYLDDVSVTEKSVPLPASLPLLGLGLVGIGLSRRTRSRS